MDKKKILDKKLEIWEQIIACNGKKEDIIRIFKDVEKECPELINPDIVEVDKEKAK